MLLGAPVVYVIVYTIFSTFNTHTERSLANIKVERDSVELMERQLRDSITAINDPLGFGEAPDSVSLPKKASLATLQVKYDSAQSLHTRLDAEYENTNSFYDLKSIALQWVILYATLVYLARFLVILLIWCVRTLRMKA